MEDDLRLLRLMMGDLASQKEIYRPGKFWADYAKRVAAAIEAEGIQSFRSNPRIGKGYAECNVSDPLSVATDGLRTPLWKALRKLPIARGLVAQYDFYNKKHLAQATQYRSLYMQAALGDWFSGFLQHYKLPDTLVGNPHRRVSIGGHEVGEAYLRMMSWVDDMEKAVELRGVRTMFEIGGGYGAMAHVLLHGYPNIRKYVYLDIPPIVYVATQYLKHFFGDAVIDYRQTRELDKLSFRSDDSLEILAICPWQIEKLDVQYDLFWNSSSFQEMPKGVVANYAKHLARLAHSDSRLALFIYHGLNKAAMHVEEVLQAVSSAGSMDFTPFPTPVSGKLIEGSAFVGVVKAAV